MKTASACHQCRQAKRKCRRKIQDRPCEQCVRRDLLCSLAPIVNEKFTRRQRRPIAAANTGELLQETPLVSRNLQVELVDHYLQYIHDRPHSLFHEPTLRKTVLQGSIRQDLVLAICALSCRFSKDESVRQGEARMFEASRQLFHETLEDVSIDSIQTCILLANLFAAELKPSSEALYYGIAIRMAHILDLTTIKVIDSPIIREVKKRIWWTLYMADRWCSSGLDLPRQIGDRELAIDLPIDEGLFRSPDFSAESQLVTSRQSLWAYMIMLVRIFGSVQDLNRQLVAENMPDDVVNHRVADIAAELETWLNALPEDIRLSESTLDKHKDRGLGGPFVALHLGYHHYSTLLYFNYLDTQHRKTSRTRDYAARCQYHALTYSWLLKMSRERRDCEAVYATVGHMAVVSSSVLLHVLLFGVDGEIDDARQSLVANFEALMELKQYWPSLEKSINRLFIFQNACLHSADTNTHKIDGWMVRFLLEHALPLDDKYATLKVRNLLNADGSVHSKLTERHRLTNNVLSKLS